MRVAIITAILCFTACLGFAGTNQANQTHNSLKVFHDSLVVKVPETREMLAEIMTVVGLHANFLLREAKVANIEASVSNRKRYILYNPNYISWISNVTRDKWAAIALLAHEVGHHLNGHTIRKSGSKPKLELEADEFAGFILRKLGASLEQSQEVMIYIARTEASRTHPSRSSRMNAIQTGWNKAAKPEGIMATANK
ncbi:MAG: M48 family metalloprotease [Chitinophagaceae bacterium]